MTCHRCSSPGGGSRPICGPVPNASSSSLLGLGEVGRRSGMMVSIVVDTGIPSRARYSSFQKRE